MLQSLATFTVHEEQPHFLRHFTVPLCLHSDSLFHVLKTSTQVTCMTIANHYALHLRVFFPGCVSYKIWSVHQPTCYKCKCTLMNIDSHAWLQPQFCNELKAPQWSTSATTIQQQFTKSKRHTQWFVAGDIPQPLLLLPATPQRLDMMQLVCTSHSWLMALCCTTDNASAA